MFLSVLNFGQAINISNIFIGIMGNQSSELAVAGRNSVASIPDSYIAISICPSSKIRVMNATADVKLMLIRLDTEIAAKCGYTRGPIIESCGILKMNVGDNLTFHPGVGKSKATLGKFFIIRLLEKMYNLGYELLVSSDLARQSDNSTMFFSKSKVPHENRRSARVCCIAPGGAPGNDHSFKSNRLVLLKHDELVKTAVLLALQEAWPNGVREQEEVTSCGEMLYEITLRGFWGSTNEDGINTRKAICNLVGRMEGLHWRLLAPINLKGTDDSYFFIYDPTFSASSTEFCMLTLAKNDRFRLINCNQLLGSMEKAISSAGFSIQKKHCYHGSNEIQVYGSPWESSGFEAISARRSISQIMRVFGESGYIPLCAINVSRSLTEKASILFRKIPHPVNCRYACLSLTSMDRLRLLDFPGGVMVQMRDILRKFYPPGIKNELWLSGSNLEIDFKGYPWATHIKTMKVGEAYLMRAVLGKMMAVAAQHGWNVSISADVSSKCNAQALQRLGVDSIYFMKIN